MPRIRLLHWKAKEAEPLIQLLRGAGHNIEYDEEFRPALMRRWRESPPDAFVIDLSRLPSHGREIAIALRQSRGTRRTPIIFCNGVEEKVESIRSQMPDAAYCNSASLPSTLKRSLAKKPSDPVVPIPMMERYASRTAAQKLGIKERSTVAVIDAPGDYLRVLGEMPQGVEICEETAEKATVTLCFIHEAESLPAKLSGLREVAGVGKLWVLWRKGGSAARGDVTEPQVRTQAIDLGLVDYKICSVNEIWTGMLFALKR